MSRPKITILSFHTGLSFEKGKNPWDKKNHPNSRSNRRRSDLPERYVYFSLSSRKPAFWHTPTKVCEKDFSDISSWQGLKEHGEKGGKIAPLKVSLCEFKRRIFG
ncbi:hypothetical protein CEXT_129491 [Caerostris extrusa]|uniref:Uncharacterized protein n=1 Tax=Caerostris extrusa TaxID=172846 RepID=A0AAV4NH80_CAEEX|nr:hypothetical protein CEXT_129491 [Caerostris extrusa]